jgi:NAD(P)-dependent dehydrogenase (short-subunit alcohol dehydrogenase family)
MKDEVAVVVGVGPGLGAALVERCARAEMNVALVARNASKLEGFAAKCSGVHHQAIAVSADATAEEDVEALFQKVDTQFGPPNLVIYNASAFVRKSLLDTSVEEFERCWRVGCLGGFLVARAAARRMLAATRPGMRGSILFTGATASLRGGAQFHNLAVGKFGLRALAQSLARELQPQGIHVAHVVVDGQIRADRAGYREDERGADAVLDPHAIAENFYQLHRQSRSAWSLEMDLRPWVEKF